MRVKKKRINIHSLAWRGRGGEREWWVGVFEIIQQSKTYKKRLLHKPASDVARSLVQQEQEKILRTIPSNPSSDVRNGKRKRKGERLANAKRDRTHLCKKQHKQPPLKSSDLK
ncbi:Cilia- and flagella-associated protein [Trichinella pseudospiralis]